MTLLQEASEAQKKILICGIVQGFCMMEATHIFCWLVAQEIMVCNVKSLTVVHIEQSFFIRMLNGGSKQINEGTEIQTYTFIPNGMGRTLIFST